MKQFIAFKLLIIMTGPFCFNFRKVRFSLIILMRLLRHKTKWAHLNSKSNTVLHKSNHFHKTDCIFGPCGQIWLRNFRTHKKYTAFEWKYSQVWENAEARERGIFGFHGALVFCGVTFAHLLGPSLRVSWRGNMVND